MKEYLDTRLIEPAEEEFYSTSDKILKLSDALAEEIVLENIREQLESEINVLTTRMNYVSLFKERYLDIDREDDYYDTEYLAEALESVNLLVSELLKKRYGVEIGNGIEFSDPVEFLTDMEALYEFLFIRNEENLINYILYKIKKDRVKIVDRYLTLLNDETHSKDLFVLQARKKFKNAEDVAIIHFLNEIIDDVRDNATSAYDLFNEIVKLDMYEEFNAHIDELLINYGNKIVFENDADSAKLYFKPLDNVDVYSSVKNAILIKYLEECEINE